jgi:hypothetical protein
MIPYTPALEQARHDAFAGADDAKHGFDSEKRIELTNCIFCPFRQDDEAGDVCMAYQQVLEDNSHKPSYCRYRALIVGGDHE